MTETKNKLTFCIIIFFIWLAIYVAPNSVLELNFNEVRRVYPSLTMIETGDWFIPVLEGEKYFKKPPMINWMIASSILIFGKNEFAARLPSALCILLLSLLIIVLNSKLLNLHARFISAIIFLTSWGIIGKGLVCEIESAYICFTGMAMLSWLALYSRDLSGLRLWLPPFFFLGFCLLLKGPLALLFFYAMILTILYSTREIRKLFDWAHLWGLLLMFGIFFIWAHKVIGLPSQSPEEKAVGTWISEMLLQLRYGRISIPLWSKRVLGSIANFAPWIAFSFLFIKPSFILHNQKELKTFKASLLSILFCLTLVNAMPGTKARYSMPLLPLASALTGLLIEKISPQTKIFKIWYIINYFLLITFSFICATLLLFCPFLIVFNAKLSVILPKSNSLLDSIFEVILNLNPSFYIITSALLCASITLLIIFAKYIVTEKTKTNSINCASFSALLVALCFLLFFAIKPFVEPFNIQKKAAFKINSFVPPGKTLNVIKIGIEPLFFYLNCEYRKFNSFKKIPVGEFYLCPEEKYFEIFESDFIPIEQTFFSIGKKIYVLIKTAPNQKLTTYPEML